MHRNDDLRSVIISRSVKPRRGNILSHSFSVWLSSMAKHSSSKIHLRLTRYKSRLMPTLSSSLSISLVKRWESYHSSSTHSTILISRSMRSPRVIMISWPISASSMAIAWMSYSKIKCLICPKKSVYSILSLPNRKRWDGNYMKWKDKSS